MSSKRNILRHPSLEGKTKQGNFSERNCDSKSTYSGFFSPQQHPRRISDPGFYRSSNPSNNLQSNSRFPKLVYEKGVKKKQTAVVNLNTQCERKYRSWSDPTGVFNGNNDISSPSGTFCKDLQTTWTLLPRLDKTRNTERDNFEEKSFCDSLSSFQCSCITSRSSSVLTDFEEECCLSKRKTVLSWVRNSGNIVQETQVPTRM